MSRIIPNTNNIHRVCTASPYNSVIFFCSFWLEFPWTSLVTCQNQCGISSMQIILLFWHLWNLKRHHCFASLRYFILNQIILEVLFLTFVIEENEKIVHIHSWCDFWVWPQLTVCCVSSYLSFLMTVWACRLYSSLSLTNSSCCCILIYSFLFL
jgi:hypothetical protein